MDEFSVAIVIPVYKEIPSESEGISLLQCFRVLSQYEIIFIAPETLDTAFYQQEAGHHCIRYRFEYFAGHFFASLNGYNRLMLTRDFYIRFASFNYILIYQLDAYIFRDELVDWCNKGYDFIGAPSVGNWTDTHFTNDFQVGNGGFSLRKVSTYINAFDYKKNLLTAKDIVYRNKVFRKPHTRIPLLILMLCGYKNKLSDFAKSWSSTEDDFWSKFVPYTTYKLTKPAPEEALEFAFERFPSELYSITGKLPFGCHGWNRYEYESFWKKYIHFEN
jgi:hypothetical protein